MCRSLPSRRTALAILTLLLAVLLVVESGGQHRLAQQITAVQQLHFRVELGLGDFLASELQRVGLRRHHRVHTLPAHQDFHLCAILGHQHSGECDPQQDDDERHQQDLLLPEDDGHHIARGGPARPVVHPFLEEFLLHLNCLSIPQYLVGSKYMPILGMEINLWILEIMFCGT